MAPMDYYAYGIILTLIISFVGWIDHLQASYNPKHDPRWRHYR
jgi:hypothetical protein